MIKIKLLFIFCFSYAKYYPQFFGLRQGTTENYYTTLIKSSLDNNYRVLSEKWGAWITTPASNQILIFNQNFQLIDSVTVPKYIALCRKAPIEKNNKLYWAATSFDTLNSSNPSYGSSKLLIVEFDLTGSILNVHKIGGAIDTLNCIGFGTIGLDIVGNNFFIIQQEYNNINGSATTIFKLNSSFSIVDSVSFNNTGLESIKKMGNSLLVAGQGVIPVACNNATLQPFLKMRLDTSLNILDCYRLDSLTTINTNTVINYYNQISPFTTYFKMLPLSNTKLLIMGNQFIGYDPFVLQRFATINCILDNNNNKVSLKISGRDTTDVVYVYNTDYFDYKNGEILTVSCRGYRFDLFEFAQSQKTSILINKMDTMGNIIWQKSYGGDMYYHPRSILYTNDGGSIISGIRYNKSQAQGTSYQGIMQSFLLKLDVNGNYLNVGLIENGVPSKSPIKCYPNPTNNKLFFDISFEQELEIKITDILGKEILKINNYKNLEEIDVNILSQGTYFYTIQTKGNNYSGKFFKE